MLVTVAFMEPFLCGQMDIFFSILHNFVTLVETGKGVCKDSLPGGTFD